MIHATVLLGFAFALIAFGGSLLRFFAQHGQQADPWVEPVSLAALALVILAVARRCWYKWRDVLELRREVRQLAEQVRELRERLRRPE